MTKKRLMALLLALVIMVSVFVGCGRENSIFCNEKTDHSDTFVSKQSVFFGKGR